MKYCLTILLLSAVTFTGAVQAGGPTNPPVPIMVDPSSLNFGEQLTGTESEPRTITLTADFSQQQGPVDVEIFGVTSSDPNFRVLAANNNCDQQTLAAKGSTTCTFDAAFAPEELGEFLANLEVDCQLLTDPGTISVSCTTSRQTRSFSDYFRGIGIELASAPVPTLGRWGITLAALMLIGLGVFRLRPVTINNGR